MTARKRSVEKPVRPEPSQREREAIAAALEALKARKPRFEVEWDRKGGLTLAAPHSDGIGHSARMQEVLATRSHGSVSVGLGMLEHVSRRRGTERGLSATDLNAALAIVEAVAPANELEAALAIQMTGCHFLAVECLGRARGTDRTDHIALYGALAVKLQRTFVAQVEALAKLRGGGKQTVEVRHVHVNGNAVIGDGTQAVFGDAKGGGDGGEDGDQPHAQGLPDLSGSPVAPLRSEDPDRHVVPVAGGGRAD